MRRHHRQPDTTARLRPPEITGAAIEGVSRLLAAVPGTVQAHATSDGGLICERRTSTVRPTLWRVAPDGTVLPDSPYSFGLREFVTASLPRGVHRAQAG